MKKGSYMFRHFVVFVCLTLSVLVNCQSSTKEIETDKSARQAENQQAIGHATSQQCQELAEKVSLLAVQMATAKAKQKTLDEQQAKIIESFKQEFTKELSLMIEKECIEKWAEDQVRCALGAKTLEEMDQCESAVDLRPLDQRPSSEDCDALISHTKKLMQAKIPSSDKFKVEAQKFTQIIDMGLKQTSKACNTTMTKQNIVCQMKAQTLQELTRCMTETARMEALVNKTINEITKPLGDVLQ